LYCSLLVFWFLWQIESVAMAAVSVAWWQHQVSAVRDRPGWRRRRHLRGGTQRDSELPRTDVRRTIRSFNIAHSFRAVRLGISHREQFF